MKDIIITVVKKIIFAICLVYAFNLVASGLKIFIPINLITVSVVASLGMCGLLALIAIYFVLLQGGLMALNVLDRLVDYTMRIKFLMFIQWKEIRLSFVQKI